MSGQQHTPVPETTPRPPAPQPDWQSPGWGWGVGRGQAPADGGSDAGWGGPPQAGAGWGVPQVGKAGGPAANGKPWTMKRGLVVAGAATVLAAGAGAAVYGLGSNAAAAGGTAAGAQGGLAQGGTQGGLSQGGAQGLPQDSGSMGGPGGMQAPGSGTVPGQGGDFGPNGLGAMGSGVSGAVHSEYVVEENGEYVTKVAQIGTVSGVSSGSVTVKSADNFTRTYTLSDATVVGNLLQRRQQSATGELTVADIAAGATVRIVAGKDGSTFPAESVQVSGTTGSTGSTQSGGTSGTGQTS